MVPGLLSTRTQRKYHDESEECTKIKEHLDIEQKNGSERRTKKENRKENIDDKRANCSINIFVSGGNGCYCCHRRCSHPHNETITTQIQWILFFAQADISILTTTAVVTAQIVQLNDIIEDRVPSDLCPCPYKYTHMNTRCTKLKEGREKWRSNAVLEYSKVMEMNPERMKAVTISHFTQSQPYFAPTYIVRERNAMENPASGWRYIYSH